MSRRPFVLVTTVTAKENVLMVREQIISCVLEAGLVPVIITGDMPRKVVDNLYQSCAGLVIPGGADINPNHYNEALSPKTIPGEPLRDRLEIDLVKRAVIDKKPLLAICRGMQILWVSQGGQLIQHLPEVTGEVHGSDNPTYQDLYKPQFVHEVFLKKGSQIEKIWRPILKGGAIKIPSMHHQSVKEKKLGGFLVSGRSKEGIIEAIELPQKTHPFCIGIQGHPEAWIISKNQKEKDLPMCLFNSFALTLR